eukprot:363431-Chlamydomonas_euryale.AAC.2
MAVVKVLSFMSGGVAAVVAAAVVVVSMRAPVGFTGPLQGLKGCCRIYRAAARSSASVSLNPRLAGYLLLVAGHMPACCGTCCCGHAVSVRHATEAMPPHLPDLPMRHDFLARSTLAAPTPNHSHFAAMSQVLSQVDSADDEEGPLYVDGLLVRTLVAGVRRPIENVGQMSRWETKRYDEVVEDYRRSIYSLRRLLLRGTAQQRTQVWGVVCKDLVGVEREVASLRRNLDSGKTRLRAWVWGLSAVQGWEQISGLGSNGRAADKCQGWGQLAGLRTNGRAGDEWQGWGQIVNIQLLPLASSLTNADMAAC